ncbi:MAG: hypothetical protein JST19_16850, partial [Bacteroidetes bacterium]|nr:hypothetical protein [Bacteroidota bacterium]
MKRLLFFCVISCLPFAALAQDTYHGPDTIKLHVEGTRAYYQQVVKVDSNIRLSSIYTRVLEFMAAKNFQQNYGYEQEGKVIFTTTQ